MSYLPDEEDRDASVVLYARELKVFVHIVDFAVHNRVAIQEVQEVHQP